MKQTPLAYLTLVIMALAAGCHGSGGSDAAAPTTAPAPVEVLIKQDARLPVVHLDVLPDEHPAGAVSRSAEFWKRVDEQRVDPPTYDLLLKNGVRVGIAPDRDWDYFREVLERNNARTVKGSVMAGGSGSLELSMKANVPTEDIFYLNGHNELHGRTYEKCDNLLGVSFWPEPRQAGALHVSLSPTIRSTRRRPEIRQNGEGREIVWVQPEYLYDLNLRTTIPPESFLVVAPSPLGDWPTSVGNAFLTSDGGAEQREQVLVFVPRTVRRGDPAVAPPVAGR